MDVDGTLTVTILRLEQNQLSTDQVGRCLVDRAADEDDALLEQALVHVRRCSIGGRNRGTPGGQEIERVHRPEAIGPRHRQWLNPTIGLPAFLAGGPLLAGVAESVDAPGLGPGPFGGGSSSLPARTPEGPGWRRDSSSRGSSIGRVGCS